MEATSCMTIIKQNKQPRTQQFTFTMFGDSMKPEIKPGDMVFADWSEPDFIMWGETYYIETSDEANKMKIVRKLIPHKEPGKIILRASNPEFYDMVWPISYIERIAVVKGIVTKSMY